MKKIRYRPRLQSLLLMVNLVVLLLPLGGISVLRLYESELVKKTESALIGEGALLAAVYHKEILKQIRESSPNREQDLKTYGEPVMPEWQPKSNDLYSPISPKLDMAGTHIREPAENGVEPSRQPDRFALAAGEELKPVILTGKKITLSGVRIVDYQGIVVASSGSELGLSLAAREEVTRALKGEYVSLLRKRISDEPKPALESISRRAWVRVFIAMPVIEQDRVLGAVILSRSPMYVDKALYLIRSHLMKAGFVLFIVVLFISVLTTLTISLPIKSLIRQADEVSLGKKGAAAAPLESPRTREVDQLSRAIARMAATLEKRADYIRAFAGNVSHEFKTPLTSLKGYVEIFQDHMGGMSVDEKNHFLAMMESDIERLDRLARSLLELARADVFNPGEEMCNVPEVMAGVEKRYQAAGRQISMSCGESTGLVRMGEETFESILSNMIENALQHGGPGTSVAIKTAVTCFGPDELLEIIISDNGKGISKANSDKIFRPFFTTARESGGSGLGLTIVKTLLEAHDGIIELVPSAHGAAFKILLQKR